MLNYSLPISILISSVLIPWITSRLALSSQNAILSSVALSVLLPYTVHRIIFGTPYDRSSYSIALFLYAIISALICGVIIIRLRRQRSD
jgi:hypothetical protein